MAPDNGQPLWVVTSQMETVDKGPDQAYVTGTRVTFRTRSGAHGSIFVAPADYTAAAVRARIDQAAAELEAVHNMTGEG